MSHRNFLALASAVLATVSHVEAQILSCADVECPIASGSTATNCTVVDKNFNAVGVASLSTNITGFSDLSWVKGVGAKDKGSKERVFDQSFYFSTLDNFDFGGAGACALLFSQVSERVRFGEDDERNTEGTCQEAMTDSCVSALIDRAKAVDLKSLSSTAACQKLGRDFSDNLDSACASFATGNRWVGIEAQALSGNGSPQPISDQQNTTSNCWPIIPKSNDLRLVESINATGDFNATTLTKNFFSITPILTVFFPGDGNSTAVSQSEAQLTCLKTIDLNTATNATKDDGGEENGAGGRLAGIGSPVLWVSLMSMVFTGLLG